LDSFDSSEESHLVDSSEFPTDSVVEDGALAEFLDCDLAAMSREFLILEERSLMLIEED
jgi:hypothetical protein